MNFYSATKIKVSVIVPVYNVEKYLEQCLESIINQNLQDIEIICIDDNSTDSSLKILQEYSRRDPRILIIKQQHLGVSAARNKGIDAAKGEYLAFVDADDYVEKNIYEILYESAKKSDADIVICGFKTLPYSKTWDVLRKSPNKILHARSIDISLNGVNIHIWNKLYKKSLITANKIRFYQDVPYGQDQAFNMITYPHAKIIEYISAELYVYRLERKGSAGMTYNNEIKLNSYFKIFEHIYKNWKDSGYLKEREWQLLSKFVSISYNSIVQMFLTFPLKAEIYTKKLLNTLKMYELYTKKNEDRCSNWIKRKIGCLERRISVCHEHLPTKREI